MLFKLKQIDREIAAEMKASGYGKFTEETGLTMISGTEMELFESDSEDEDLDDQNQLLIYGPQPQIITNDLKSLDEMVISIFFHFVTIFCGNFLVFKRNILNFIPHVGL